jgi:hypothetical protein
MRLLLSFVLLSSGCAASGSPATVRAPVVASEGAGPPARTQTTPTEPSDDELAQRGLIVLVEDHGAEPKKKVVVRSPEGARRFRIAGHTEHVANATYGGRPGGFNGKPLTSEVRAELRTKPGANGRVDCVLVGEEDGEDPYSSGHFDRNERGAISRIEVLTGDQMTGDADDEGDGLVQHDRWPVVVRLALRLTSAPFPDDEIGVGARWHAFERVRVDHVWTRRHARYELLGWTDRGVRLSVTADETAAPQKYTGLEHEAEQSQSMMAELEKQLGGKIHVTLSPEAQQAVASAFPLKTLHGAKQHATGEVELDLGASLPVHAKLVATASYDVEAPTYRQQGDVRRTIVVEAVR